MLVNDDVSHYDSALLDASTDDVKYYARARLDDCTSISNEAKNSRDGDMVFGWFLLGFARRGDGPSRI